MATKKTKTSNVVALKGDHIPGEVNRGTVEILEELLDGARRGEVVGLVYGAVKGNNQIQFGNAGGPDYWTLIAAANLAAKDILDRHRQENDV